MNTNNSKSHSSPENGGVAYGIGLSFGVVVLIILASIASYFCTRNLNTNQHATRHASTTSTERVTIAMGLDEVTVGSYPKLLYSQASTSTIKSNSCEHDQQSRNCSICLCEYEGNDIVRLLPDCGHFFHLNCLDPWLRLRSTCPICRNSPWPPPPVLPLSG